MVNVLVLYKVDRCVITLYCHFVLYMIVVG